MVATWALWGLHQCGEFFCLGTGYEFSISALQVAEFFRRENCWEALGTLQEGEHPNYNDRGRAVWLRSFGAAAVEDGGY